MTFQPGLLDTNMPTRVLSQSKIDLATPVNIFTSLQANKRAQKLAELTMTEADKKKKRETDYQKVMQSNLNPDGTINAKGAIAGLNQKGMYKEASKIQDRMMQTAIKRKEEESKVNLELGKMADAVLQSENPVDAFMIAREDATKRGIKMSEGLLNYMPTDEEIVDGGLDPRVRTELDYLSKRAIAPKGPMSVEEKLLLMNERYKQKKELAQTKSDVKVAQSLTEAEKSRERIAKQKVGIAGAKLGLEKEKAGRESEKFEEDKKKWARGNRAYKQKTQGQIDSLVDYIDLAEDIRDNPNLKFVTGIGKMGRFVPGTGAADLAADIDRIGSAGVIEIMTKLKAESPTGSTGFGALSEKELSVLKNSFSIIENPNISPAKKKQEIDRVLKIMNKRLKEQRTLNREAETLLGPEKEENLNILNDDDMEGF